MPQITISCNLELFKKWKNFKTDVEIENLQNTLADERPDKITNQKVLERLFKYRNIVETQKMVEENE